jgi:hypothetical protein
MKSTTQKPALSDISDAATVVVGVRMTRSLRLELERMRAERGHRSVAETVREMISYHSGVHREFAVAPDED